MRVALALTSKGDEVQLKKVTPTHDLSWYLKWVATVFVVLGASLNAFDIEPYNVFVLLIGTALWMSVGLLWFDRALIVVNAAIFAIYLAGIFSYFVLPL
jgi:hypothetical protein|tara:strand:+ start:35 stop:331 length:297 start_codon:yes stop_codon:yes gene_type:complete